MNEPLKQAVTSSTLRVLETAAFVSVWPWQEQDGELPAPDIAASMCFDGPTKGRLTLRMSSQALPTLTENMLGELPQDESLEEKTRDGLREVLNMICGNLLTTWKGPEPVFKLSTPQIVGVEEHAAGIEERVQFCLENTMAVVEITIRNESST